MRRFAAVLAVLLSSTALGARYCRIEVVDATNQAPVAGALLTTVHNLRFVTDRNGVVAFYEPGLMGSTVFFFVERSGYQLPADFLGFRGVALQVNEGGVARISLPRAPSVDAGPVPAVTDSDSRLLDAGVVPDAGAFLRVDAVDPATGRGIPLVFLETPYGQFITDSAGVAAVFHPDAMGRTVPVTVWSYGYQAPDGGALSLTLTPGARQTLSLTRLLPAERLYRVTGGGAYRDSTLLGLPVPRARPNLAGRVLGQDSVQSTVYRGRAFFVWGDTNRPEYPLGNFFSTGGTAALPGDGGRPPGQGLDLEYVVDVGTGFVQPLLRFDTAPQPMWMTGLSSVKDFDGGEALYGFYAKVGGNFAKVRQGVVRWNDALAQFDLVRDLPVDGGAPLELDTHPLTWVQSDGERWLYLPPALRLPASAAGYETPSSWEGFAPPRLSDGGVAREPDGGVAYAWRANARRLPWNAAAAGLVPAWASLTEQAREAPSGRAFTTHANDTVQWNAHRGRFVRFASESVFVLGDLFFQEADTPMGPWVWARRVATHQGYTFYNPRQHQFLDEDGGRVVYVEGTYTAWLSAAQPTTRYDYNQVMYRVDLTDERLSLPVPVYPGALPRTKADLAPESPWVTPAFFAYDRPAPGRVPVSVAGVCTPSLTVADAGFAPLFWGAAADAGVALALSTLEGVAVRGFDSPLRVALPVGQFQAQGISVSAGADLCVPEGPLTLTAQVAAAAPVVDVVWTLDGVDSRVASLSAVLAPGLHEVRLRAVDAEGHEARHRVFVEATASGGGSGGGGGGAPGTPSGCGCGASGAEALALAALVGIVRRRRPQDGRRSRRT